MNKLVTITAWLVFPPLGLMLTLVNSANKRNQRVVSAIYNTSRPAYAVLPPYPPPPPPPGFGEL